MRSGVVLGLLGALLLVGAVVISQDGSDRVAELRRNRPELSVFVDPHASDVQIDAVEDRLRRIPEVGKLDYVDHAEAYAEFKEMFKAKPEETAGITAEDLPTSFRFRTRTRADARSVQTRLKGTDAVVEVAIADRPATAADRAEARSIRRRAVAKAAGVGVLALLALALSARAFRAASAQTSRKATTD